MATSPVMSMLNDGVPITLLCDLVSITEPDSQSINSAERPETDPIWLEAAETLRAHVHARSA